MCCYNNWTFISEGRDLRYNVPHESLCLRINTSRWLIKENNWRITQHSHGNWKLSLISTWQVVGSDVSIRLKIHIGDCPLNEFLSQSWSNTFQCSIDLKMFQNCKAREDSIKLRAIANHLSRLVKFSFSGEIKTINGDSSHLWLDHSSQTLEGCCLSSSWNTK